MLTLQTGTINGCWLMIRRPSCAGVRKPSWSKGLLLNLVPGCAARPRAVVCNPLGVKNGAASPLQRSLPAWFYCDGRPPGLPGFRHWQTWRSAATQ